MKKRNKLSELWNQIPDDIQIMACHGAPSGILDLAFDFSTGEIVQAGCSSLYKRIMNSNISHCLFGHLHNTKKLKNNGVLLHNNKTFVNASCLNHENNEFYQGHIITF